MSGFKVSFLWHFHQPCYFDHHAGHFRMPWVRLHGTRDYIGLPMLLDRYGGLRTTINITPALVSQLRDYASGRAGDDFLEFSRRPAADLDADGRLFILRNFFSINRETAIDESPRFGQLAEKRGDGVSAAALQGRAGDFSTAEMRDLQVLFNLAWFHPLLRAGEPLLKTLVRKGRSYSEDDKDALLDLQTEVLGRVIPLWRKLAGSGRVEFSVTPFYHPIMPLLLDGPGAQPGDAGHQLRSARSFFEEVLGYAPTGCWPSEGAVSNETLDLIAAEGFEWTATDEGILKRSLPENERPENFLYRAYRYDAPAGPLRVVFRDHRLSDRLGFVYRSWESKAAAGDFIGGLLKAGERLEGADQGITIILDGENAWEYYPGGGLGFLSGLFSGLEKEKKISVVSVGELATAGTGFPLGGIHAGSWINSDFHIWAGYPAADAAWDMLARARGDKPAADIDPPARDAILAAEGSDWFWWYSPEHASGRDDEFDEIFRTHIMNFFRLRGQPEPSELHRAIGKGKAGVFFPRNPIKPRIDGREGSYYEWLGAGAVRGSFLSGAMHSPVPLIRAMYFGWDSGNLYLRFDPETDPGTSFSSGGFVFCLDFGSAGKWSFETENGKIKGNARHEFLVAADEIIEIAFPLDKLAVEAGEKVGFHLEVRQDGKIVARCPVQGELQLTVPGYDYEREFW